ncbi:La-related protein 1C [Hirschfeldia incana]|nr:La-related protein 1C [Hirschfeldia incana]
MDSSATSNNSPRHTTENRGSPTAAASQQSRRPSRHVSSSPWTQIVRGESDPPTISPAAAAPSSPQSKPLIDPIAASPPPVAAGEEKTEGNGGKKPVWKRPSNGGGDAAASASEVGPVMGASSWPALSEATTTTTNKSSSSDSIKSLAGGDVVAPSSPIPISQGIASASVPASKTVGRANPNPTPNHSRQRSFKKNGAASGSSAANGGAPQQSAQGSLSESPSHNPSPRGQNQRNGFPSQTHGGGGGVADSYRNQNGNNHHQSHGGRRNQEHGNQNWNFSRSFNGRDGNNVHSQRGAPAFVRHPPPPPVQTIPQFMAAAQPVPPFATPLPFPPELASQYYQRMPFVAPLSPGPVFYHVQDLPLNIKLQKQIHYYFSEENLIKDTYLRRQMDDQGFVPLPVIAGFKKVAELTDSVQQIADALQGSPVVEIQGDRIRKRFNWQHWLLPQEPNPAVSSPQSVGAVASRVGNLALGESSAGSSSQVQPAGAENVAVSDGQQQSPGGVPVSNRNDSDGANR